MIDFKMTKDGLVLVVKDYDSIDEVLDAISQRISEMKNFFTKGDVISLFVENHTKHIQDIPKMISSIKNFGLEVERILVGTYKGDSVKVSGKLDMIKQKETKSGTKLVKRNIRSGQVIVHSGDVILVGNLHQGAEIMAGGSLVVFGSARGSLRAGLNEGYSAVIMAVDLRPSLMQISDRISHESGERNVPSVAHVREGKIVVERWNEVKFREVMRT